MSKEIIHQALGYFQAILYSMKMAKTNGNDWRREIQLTENTANHAIDAIKSALAQPQQTPKFPTMLRKMWSGVEVQDWIDQNWTKSAQPEQDRSEEDGVPNKPKVRRLMQMAKRMRLCLPEHYDEAYKELQNELYKELAKPELNPVEWDEFAKWMHREVPSGTVIGDSGWWASKIYSCFIQNIAPQKHEFKDLTQDQIAEIFWSMPEGLKGFSVQWGWMQFSDALILAFKEKNA